MDVRAIGLKVLAAIERKFSGDDFAMNVCMQYGDEAYQQIRAMGKSFILAMIQSDAELAKAFGALEPGRLDTWLDEFLAYGEPNADDAKTGAE